MFGPSNGCGGCCAFGVPRNVFVGAALGLTFFALGNYLREAAAHGSAAGDTAIILFQESLSAKVSKHRTLIDRIAKEIYGQLQPEVTKFVPVEETQYRDWVEYAKSEIKFHHAVVMQFEDEGDAGISLTILLQKVLRGQVVGAEKVPSGISIPFGFKTPLRREHRAKITSTIGQVVRKNSQYYFKLDENDQTLVADCIMPLHSDAQYASKLLTVSYGDSLRRSAMGSTYAIKDISRQEIDYICSPGGPGKHPGRGVFRHSVSGFLLKDLRKLELYWISKGSSLPYIIVTFEDAVNDVTLDTAAKKVVEKVREMEAARQLPE